MKIREMNEEEHYSVERSLWRCPVCNTSWLEEEDGEFIFDTCEHLLFELNDQSDDEFELHGQWDHEGFLDIIEAARVKDEEDGDYREIIDILSEISHPDIDGVVYYIWQDDPLYNPWRLWGYKES